MKTKLLFIAPLFIIQCSMAQWSTSTNAENALYVCPGFVQTILTFDDGSSIICGALDDSRYAQKLDPYGYKLWPQPVEIMNTPGTGNDGISTPISDGDGGFFVWWPDNRGAELGQFGYFNNAVYMQHIDKNGNAAWGNGGIQLAPVDGGIKNGFGVSDGSGGIILGMWESDFLRTGASMQERTWLVNYDAAGQKKWEHKIDSSMVQYQLTGDQPIKLGNKIMIGTLNGLKFIDPSSGDTLPHPAFRPHGSLITYKDSVAYNFESRPNKTDSLGNRIFVYGITQVSSNWDSVWYAEYQSTDDADDGGYGYVVNDIFPNKYNGLFSAWAYRSKTGIIQSRAQWITHSGSRWGKEGVQIKNHAAYFTFTGENKFGMYFNDGAAQLIDSMGNLLWDTNYVVISDPLSAYSPWLGSDNNGGGIIVYWSTLGGIYAQHTGRTGKVGTITKVPTNETVPLEFELSQNYPNPFNPTTTIQFVTNSNQLVTLNIFDILGREIHTLVNKRLQRGKYEVQWNASKFSSGVYFYTLTSGNNTITKKMLLTK